MKPSELYARTPSAVSYNLYLLSRVLEEEGLYNIDPGSRNQKLRKVEIRIYKDFVFDDRRTWTLLSAFFEGKPVFILQQAGREGGDHTETFITDREQWLGLIYYARSLCPEDDNPVYDPEEDIENLDQFYGCSLSTTDWDGISRRDILYWAGNGFFSEGTPKWLKTLTGLTGEAALQGKLGSYSHPEELVYLIGEHLVTLCPTNTTFVVKVDGETIIERAYPLWEELREYIRCSVIEFASK